MKDTNKKINYDTVNRLLEFCSNREIEYVISEGALLDNYLIYANKSIKVGRIAPRDYIIIKEAYKNHWESEYVACFTDKEELANEFELLLDKDE